MARDWRMDALISAAQSLAQEGWPRADLFLHGSPVEAVAIPRSMYRRLLAALREIELESRDDDV